jgi:quercetin dioxygenase-like cupin family protein
MMLPMSDIVVDPVRRQRYRFSRDSGDLIAEVETDPGGDVPEHVHPVQTEWWEVLAGDVTFVIDGQARRASAGERICAEAGARHAFVNDGSTIAVLTVRVSPAGELQEFLTEAARLAAAGAFNQRGIPSSPAAALRVARLALRYRADIQITSPPPARLLNLIGRVLPSQPRVVAPRTTTPQA